MATTIIVNDPGPMGPPAAANTITFNDIYSGLGGNNIAVAIQNIWTTLTPAVANIASLNSGGGSSNGIFAGNVVLQNSATSVQLPPGSWVDFNNSDQNWRIGYGLNAYSTMQAGANTTVEIVIGTASEGPDSFAVGQTGGQSILEVIGYNSSTWLRGDLHVNQNIYAVNGVQASGTIQAQANVSFGQTHIGPPSTDGSSGEKLLLWDQTGQSIYSYAMGIEVDNMWFGVDSNPNPAEGFKWYETNNVIMQLGRNGNLSVGSFQVNSHNFTITGVPTHSTGASGDVTGDVAFDNSYFYYCSASYDGATNIWKRVNWSAGTW